MDPNAKPPKEHQFTSEKQPTKEQREKASRTRKLRLKLKPYIAKYGNMTVKEFEIIQKDIKKNPDNYTMFEIAAINATIKISKDFKYYQDHRDRSEGRAIQKQEIQTDSREEVTVKADVEVENTLKVDNDYAAQVLSILVESGAFKGGAKKITNSENDKVDTSKSDT